MYCCSIQTPTKAMLRRLIGPIATLVTVCALFFGALWFSETFLENRDLVFSVFIFTLFVWVGKHVDPIKIPLAIACWLGMSLMIGFAGSVVASISPLGHADPFLSGVLGRFIEGAFMITGLPVGWFVFVYVGNIVEKFLYDKFNFRIESFHTA